VVSELRDFREQAGIFCRNAPAADAFAGAYADERSSAGLTDHDLEMFSRMGDLFAWPQVYFSM